MKKSLLTLGVIATLLVLFTVASIKWPDRKKPLGDEYTAHLYSQDTFFQYYPLIEEDRILLKRGSDDWYNCEWNFIYNEDAKAYEISTLAGNNIRYYLTMNDNNELELSETCTDNSDRWNLVKVNNSLYYAVVNAGSDYALLYDVGNPDDVGTVAPLDMEYFEFWTRIQ